jgi:hypothetical protein
LHITHKKTIDIRLFHIYLLSCQRQLTTKWKLGFNVEHDEAKKYIEIWVNDREMNEFEDCPTTQEQRQVVFVLFIKVYTTQV